MNKLVWTVSHVVSKSVHKLIEEPIKKCMLGKARKERTYRS